MPLILRGLQIMLEVLIISLGVQPLTIMFFIINESADYFLNKSLGIQNFEKTVFSLLLHNKQQILTIKTIEVESVWHFCLERN